MWPFATNRGAPPPLEMSVREAAQQHLGKESKLEIARQAVMTDDLRQIAQADREKVRQLEEKYARINTGSGNDLAGDLMVADNVTIHSGGAKANGWKSALLGAALACGLIGAGIGLAALLGIFNRPLSSGIAPPDVNLEPLDLRIRWWIDDSGEPQVHVEEVD